jgi:hypothetical protein
MGNFLKAILAALAGLMLAACTTPQQKAVQMQAEMDRMMVIYGPACSKLGYPTNSDQWRNCVLQLSAKEEIERYGHPHYYAGFGRSHWGFGGRWGPYW